MFVLFLPASQAIAGGDHGSNSKHPNRSQNQPRRSYGHEVRLDLYRPIRKASSHDSRQCQRTKARHGRTDLQSPSGLQRMDERSSAPVQHYRAQAAAFWGRQAMPITSWVGRKIKHSVATESQINKRVGIVLAARQVKRIRSTA